MHYINGFILVQLNAIPVKCCKKLSIASRLVRCDIYKTIRGSISDKIFGDALRPKSMAGYACGEM